jgi:O-antigen ligase
MRAVASTRLWLSTAGLPYLVVGIGVGIAIVFSWALVQALTIGRFMNWLVLAAVVAAAIAPLILRWPVVSTFGVYAFLAASLDALPLMPGGGSLARPVGLLTGSALLAAGLVHGRFQRPPRAALWWSLLMLWGVLSAAWALDPEPLFARLPTALSLVILYLVAVCFVPTRRELYWVCVLTVLGGVFAASLAYMFGFNEEATGQAVRGRLMLANTDTNSNPNTLGRVLLLPLVLSVTGFVVWRGILQRALSLGCAALLSLGIFISMSRGALVSIAVALSVLLYRMRARWQIVAVMIVLLLISAAAPAAFYERVGAAVSGEDATGSGRTEIWKTALQAFERSRLVGVGLENFKEVYALYVTGSRGKGTHNTFLMVLIELGVIGLVLMLAALSSEFLAARRARSTGHRGVVLAAVEAACLGTLASNVFADYLWTKSFWLVWILLTWAILADRQPNEETA